jgi:23S rRNA (pseudouridine1915-N3)-methyltransferase
VKIQLLCVGKPREPLFVRLHDEFAERLRRCGVHYDATWVPDVRAGGRYTKEHALEREARLLLERIGREKPRTVVALHDRGELLTSRRLAERLESWATPGLTLVVGGPEGLHPSVCARADHAWSLSPLTFPHELVRGIVAEQLYRAVALCRGLSYPR